MSNLRRALIALLAVLTMLPFANAEAAAAPKGPSGTVERTAEDNVIVRVADAKLSLDDGYLVFSNEAGKELERFNLTAVGVNNDEHEIAAVIKGDTAVLTPNKVAKKQRPRKPGEIVCGPQTRAQRDQEALTRMNSELGTSSTIGALIGTAVGAALAIATMGALVIAVPIGALVGAGIGLGGAAATGTFDRYNKTIKSPFIRQYC